LIYALLLSGTLEVFVNSLKGFGIQMRSA